MLVPLDMAGIHGVTVERAAGGRVEVRLSHQSHGRRSTTHELLVRQLCVRDGGVLHRFDPATNTAVVPGVPSMLELALVDAPSGREPLSIVTLELGADGLTAERPSASRYLLSPFELRYAADAGALHAVPLSAREGRSSWRPVTDLHTHFAGCVRADDLVRLGIEHGVRYPRALLLDEPGEPGESSSVALADLSAPLRERLIRRLSVRIDRRVTFLEMERVYRLRGPLTKAAELFVPLCRQIAADYASMGIRYVELSLGKIVEAETLRAVHREVPAIEKESGVTMRFLAAISRHDDPEWDLDLVERIKALAGSVYVAGVDFMGHETNSTRAFAPVIRALSRWAHHERPGFVVRVHAGESPSHPENVRVALEETDGSDVEVRIGHGLFGVDDATLAEIARRGAAVEFNLDSNVALNHLQSARAVPLRRYVEAGVPVVLGSDGYGIYQTNPAAAAQAARIAGLHASHLDGPLREAERGYLERAHRRDAALIAGMPAFVVPDDAAPLHFTPAVVERRRAEVRARDAAIDERLAALGIPVVATSDVATLGDGAPPRVVSVAGAWRQSWEGLSAAERTTIETEIAVFVANLPSNVVLLTGGTSLGVEGIVGEAAVRRGLVVLGTLVRGTPPAALAPGRMTHACFVGETLYDKAAGLYALLAEHDGVAVFVAGGQIVSDEIQTARNLGLRYLLMDGVGGASSRHAVEKPARAFRRGLEAIHAMEAWHGLSAAHTPHWYDGPNPTVDAVVLRDAGDLDGARASEVLLVLRGLDAPAEPGKWALPGGFVASSSPRGGPWKARADESDEAACVRHLAEETGVAIAASQLVRLGSYEGGGRDPRDGPRSWSRSTAFVAELGASAVPEEAMYDATDTQWFFVDRLPRDLAFDHRKIIGDALARRSPA